jgi:hypothetical protein
MDNTIQTSTLTHYLDVVTKNFNAIRESFPKLYLSAEVLNDLFDQLFTKRVVPNEELWQQESLEMLFGCFSSWSHAFVMTAAGLGEHGMTSLRRAIEFVCYIAKVRGSDERAALWIERRENKENKRHFSSQFSIPRCYFTSDYAHLKPLLVWHNHTSDFGAHGNFATLVTKRRDNSSGSLLMSLQDDPKGVPLSTGVCVQMGSFILDALMVDLQPLIKDNEEFQSRVSVFREMLKKAKAEIAKYEYKDQITPEIFKGFIEYDSSSLDEEYDKLRKEYTD